MLLIQFIGVIASALYVNGFIPSHRFVQRTNGITYTGTSQLKSTGTSTSPAEGQSFLERLLEFLFEALPAAMSPLPETMDDTKIIKNPPKWVKPSTISDLRKKHHSSSLW